MESVLESLDYSIHKFTDLFSQSQFYNELVESKQEELENKRESVTFIKNTKEIYMRALDIVYAQSIGVLKDTLNTALKYIMYDKNYSVDLQIDDSSRGNKALEIFLVDEDEGGDSGVDLKDVGQGIRTIISFVLKYYYLMNKGSNILFLDEKYSALSAHYVPRFFEFVLNLCKKNGTKIILITHDERFMDYATKTYAVNDGCITLLGDNTSDKKREDSKN